jgi:hypothetical protein
MPDDRLHIHRPIALRRPWALLALACGLLAPIALWADTPSGGSYRLTKQAIAGGGARSTGGSYTLVATVGQSVAGQTDEDGAVIQQGFHASITPKPDSLFSNSFEEIPF